MEDILASIRRIISDEPASFPAAEPRFDPLRAGRRSTDTKGNDFARDDAFRDELRARLLQQDGDPKPHEAAQQKPSFMGSAGEAVQEIPGDQSSQATALTLDSIPSALEAELQHSDLDTMLAKLHDEAQRAQANELAPDILDEGAPDSTRAFQFAEEQKRSEEILGDLAAELVNQEQTSDVEQAEEAAALSRAAEARQPPRAMDSSRQPRAFSQQARHSEKTSLISDATSAAVDSAFNALAETVLVQNGRTLEDLVREMLRPMLKSWLDDNLPNLVERLVRAEIERVSRGR
jgi:cell pole-organizing protein PopZ